MELQELTSFLERLSLATNSSTNSLCAYAATSYVLKAFESWRGLLSDIAKAMISIATHMSIHRIMTSMDQPFVIWWFGVLFYLGLGCNLIGHEGKNGQNFTIHAIKPNCNWWWENHCHWVYMMEWKDCLPSPLVSIMAVEIASSCNCHHHHH